MMKKSVSLLLDFAIILLIGLTSSADVMDEGEGAGGDAVPPKNSFPDLPEFKEGVTVTVLDRVGECPRMAFPGDWLELEFVAKQMSDDGETYEEFDSSYSKERPLFLAVSDNEKLPGLTEGLRNVCVGEKRQIIIQAESPLMQVDPKSGLEQPKTDRPAVYEVKVRSILDQEPVNLFTKMDLDNNNQLSREELKSFFAKQAPEGMTEDDMHQVIEGLMRMHDLDTNDHLSEAEFPTPHQHTEL
ncbi:peptidyl-prolyl cis-trans isomerase FKBP10-like isoform X2 [Acanthaster planci]|uniref:peptidylprolyl isomerase n=1 Tax=Acanthaster planci TaxID=133434 RepID=A0A8B7XHE7_ACAPL|nr:peptidyl-prolyl cis-trans isomerase FKBP10-like isoform X2 [Acanthaster planci]